MKQTKVALCRSGDFDPDHALVESLRMQFPTVSLVDLRKEEFADQLEELKDTEAFIGWPDDEQLRSLPLLRWIQLPSAGANGYTSGRSSLREEVQITNSSGVFGVPGAEHALALLLAIARQLPVHFEQQQGKQWRRNPYSQEIDGSTAAVIGLGDIGMEIARRVKAFGASVLAVKRVPSVCPVYVDRLYTEEYIDEVLAVSDYVFLALPLTEGTKGFLSAERIARMKKGAVLINVGRGPTVDERALIEALRNGHLLAAGLDVTDVEPLPADNPLWKLPNVIITSHSVGVSPRKEERRVQLFRQNIERFLANEPLLNLVDRKAGY